jgi:hypothetical protein
MVPKCRTEASPPWSLARQQAAAEITAPMPRQKTYRLGGDPASLDAGQYRLGFVERQADHPQPVAALV